MIMPFVRLLGIYALVAIAITAYFNRDSIAMLVSGPETEQVAEPAAEPAAAPVVEPQPEGTVVQETANPVQQPQAPILAPVLVQDLETGLTAARQAFWDGDRDQAEVLYLALTRDHPFETDIWGELGNLYFSMGRIDEAAQSYHSAGSVALQAGDLQHAKNIIGFLRGMDSDKADELHSLLEAVEATQTE